MNSGSMGTDSQDAGAMWPTSRSASQSSIWDSTTTPAGKVIPTAIATAGGAGSVISSGTNAWSGSTGALSDDGWRSSSASAISATPSSTTPSWPSSDVSSSKVAGWGPPATTGAVANSGTEQWGSSNSGPSTAAATPTSNASNAWDSPAPNPATTTTNSMDEKVKQGDWSNESSKLTDTNNTWPNHNRVGSGSTVSGVGGAAGVGSLSNRSGWPISSTDTNTMNDSPSNAISTPLSGVPPVSLANPTSQLDAPTPSSQPNQPALPTSTASQWDTSNVPNLPNTVPSVPTVPTTSSTPASVPSAGSTGKSQISGDISATSSVSGDSGSTQPRTRQDIMSQAINSTEGWGRTRVRQDTLWNVDSVNTGVSPSGVNGSASQNVSGSSNSQISPMVSSQRQNISAMHHSSSTNGMPPSILPPSMNIPPMNDEPAINNWTQSQPVQPINNGTGIWENGSNKDPRMSQAQVLMPQQQQQQQPPPQQQQARWNDNAQPMPPCMPPTSWNRPPPMNAPPPILDPSKQSWMQQNQHQNTHWSTNGPPNMQRWPTNQQNPQNMSTIGNWDNKQSKDWMKEDNMFNRDGTMVWAEPSKHGQQMQQQQQQQQQQQKQTNHNQSNQQDIGQWSGQQGDWNRRHDANIQDIDDGTNFWNGGGNAGGGGGGNGGGGGGRQAPPSQQQQQQQWSHNDNRHQQQQQQQQHANNTMIWNQNMPPPPPQQQQQQQQQSSASRYNANDRNDYINQQKNSNWDSSSQSSQNSQNHQQNWMNKPPPQTNNKSWNDMPTQNAEAHWAAKRGNNRMQMNQQYPQNSVSRNQHPMRSHQVDRLIEFGFKKDDAHAALIHNNNNFDSALADLFIAAKRENDGKPSKVRPLRGNGGNTGTHINPEVNNQMHNASQVYNRNLQKNTQEVKMMASKQPANQIGNADNKHQEIVHQLRIAVNHGLISPTLLNQPMTPRMLLLLQHLLDLQQCLQKLTERLRDRTMPSESRHDLEQTISHIDAQILSQKQVINEEVANANKSDDKSTSDQWSTHTGRGDDNFDTSIDKAVGCKSNPMAPSHSTPNFMDSAFFDNRWSSTTGNTSTPSLPVGSREAWSSALVSTGAGSSGPTNTSASSAASSLGSQGPRGIPTSSSSGDDQCFANSNSSSCSPSLTIGSESPSDLGIVEFVPGKKWIEPKITSEDDPYLTPGSMAEAGSLANMADVKANWQDLQSSSSVVDGWKMAPAASGPSSLTSQHSGSGFNRSQSWAPGERSNVTMSSVNPPTSNWH